MQIRGLNSIEEYKAATRNHPLILDLKGPRTLISNEPKDSSRTVSSHCVSDSNSGNMDFSDGPKLKRMKGQGSTTDGRESDRRTKAKMERALRATRNLSPKQTRRTAIQQPIRHTII